MYDALKQKYLKCLLFGISEDEGGSCLMEVPVSLLPSASAPYSLSLASALPFICLASLGACKLLPIPECYPLRLSSLLCGVGCYANVNHAC